MLVWKAISSMVLMILEMSLEERLTASIAPCISCIFSAPSSAELRAWLAASFALDALTAL